jgi:hypothetical protein
MSLYCLMHFQYMPLRSESKVSASCVFTYELFLLILCSICMNLKLLSTNLILKYREAQSNVDMQGQVVLRLLSHRE